MKKNMGVVDKVIRLAVVAAIAGLYFAHMISGVAAIILGIVAVIFFLTSLAGICLVYLPFGISTAKKH